MDETATGSRAARSFAVLAILLGLLAMHGVASAHHAAATPAPSHSALPAAGPTSTQVGGHDDHQAAFAETATGAEADVVTSGPVGPTCHDDCAGITVLCLAVLTGVTLALLLTRRRTSPPPVRPTRHTARRPAPAVGFARRPDPVRELCVNRT